METLFTSVCGSYLHRTANSKSDKDVRTVYSASLRERLSPFFERSQVNIESDDDHVAYELSHFVRMLAKCNPTAMEVAASDLMSGQVVFARQLLYAALDTEKYVSQCNGFVKGMFHNGSPKALHHGVRVASHLRRYILTGELIFDTSMFPEYEEMLRVKAGLRTPHEREFDPQEAQTVWHVQSLDKLEDLVYNTYLTSGA